MKSCNSYVAAIHLASALLPANESKPKLYRNEEYAQLTDWAKAIRGICRGNGIEVAKMSA